VETGDVFASSRVSGRNNDMDTTYFFSQSGWHVCSMKIDIGFSGFHVCSIHISG